MHGYSRCQGPSRDTAERAPSYTASAPFKATIVSRISTSSLDRISKTRCVPTDERLRYPVLAMTIRQDDDHFAALAVEVRIEIYKMSP